MFARVQRQPLDEAEFDQAITRLQQYQAGLSGSPGDSRQRERAKRMEQILQMRKELGESQRKNRESDAAIRAARSGMAIQLAQYERQRIYTIIGRLIPSTVYDGDRLPLLYRVQSPEPGTARTLGYLQPSKELDLTGKLGQIVGMVGETKFDETLKATLITARRVDVVSLAPLQALPANTAIPAPPGGQNPAQPAPQFPVPAPVPDDTK